MRTPLPYLFAAVLVAGVLVAGADEDRRAVRPAVFPCRFGLEGKWEACQDPQAPAAAIHALIQEDREGQNLVRWGENRSTSIWSAVDRMLPGRRATLAALRTRQDAEARVQLDAARRAGGPEAIFALFRRYPWSAAVHEALVELGEQELRRGHAGVALRCFEDARARAEDPALRGRAQVGVWLALAQDAPEELDSAFRGVPPDARYPWLGGPARADVIKERLTAAAPPPPAPITLAALDHRVLSVPASPTWVHDQPVVSADGVLVGGPNLLAWYAGDDAKPTWAHVFPRALSTELWAVVAPGPFQPAVVDGRIYTRWGVEPVLTDTRTRRQVPFLAHVAAFETRTGTLLWSTAGIPAWDDLGPVSDPTFAEGRLYVLAARKGQEFAPIFLVCLDPDTGAVHWRRELLAHHTTLVPRRELRRPPGYSAIDVTHFGNAVTVARGAIYCQTNTGAVARCDARDGVIEWVRTYPRDPGDAPFITLLRRQGAAPIVAGPHVLFLPRDALTLFALDATTGELLWQKADSSFWGFGVAGDTLLLADSRAVAGVDVATGKPAWQRRFDESIAGRIVRAGPALYVGTPGWLYRLDAGTGAVAEERAWGPRGPLTSLALRGRTLIGTAPARPPD
jgi:outer membrane protein assembly factor BamB